MAQLKIDRRLFLAGTLASATVARVLAQGSVETPFAARYRALLARFSAAHPGLIRDIRLVSLPGNERPWHELDLTLAQGDGLSLFAAGAIYVSRALNLSLLPRVVLWARVGDADVFRPGSDTYSFRAHDAGVLRLATLQGRWSTPRGDHPAPSAYDAIEGALDVLVIRWQDGDAQRGIAALAAFAPDDPLFAAEARRLQTNGTLPTRFTPLWYVGSGDNFAETIMDGKPAIALRSELNAGIIRAPLDLPATAGLHVAWTWRVNQLPAVRAEDAAPFHQYASVAVEFDDGQDLSWYWSATIAPETHYRCPFPSWPGETHLVVRSGGAEQGQWVQEQRELSADIAAALTRIPSRVKGLWLIASTVFGARPASVDFRDIVIVDAQGERHPVFPV